MHCTEMPDDIKEQLWTYPKIH